MSTWTTYFQAAATTAGTLVGLVFVAVSLSPTSLLTELRAGLRARAGFYLLTSVLLVSIVELTPLPPLIVGLAQIGVCAAVFATLIARNHLVAVKAGAMHGWVVFRATLAYVTLALVVSAGVARGVGLDNEQAQLLVAIALFPLLALGISNAWMLVVSYAGQERR